MPIRPADIEWRGNQPLARHFDDIYFSNDGVAETRRVFIQPSGILEQALHQPTLCVGELGFGTGLNFAVLAHDLLQHTNTRLRFISFEKFPLRQRDWDTAAQARGAELPLYKELAQQAPPLLPGWHQRVLADGRVTLQVYHGDAADGLADLAARQTNAVDAWFLDGFAPAKNPDMWAQALYPRMASLAGPHTTVATFTAAGAVRRGLQAAGFEMRKVDQQPFKRESLAGVYRGVNARADKAGHTALKAAVIHGAGMAGAFTARHLADAGVEVTVFDPNGIAGGASVMPATVLHSRLLGDGSANADLRCAAFHYAVNYLQRFGAFQPTGVTWIQGPNLNDAKLQRISAAYQATDADQQGWIQHLSAAQASERCAAPIGADALYHPGGGVVDAAALCRELLGHPNIEVIAAAGEIDPAVPNIVCAATATRRFPGCELLEITNIYGQLDWYDCDTRPAAMPVVGNGYLIPTDGGCVLGASYEHKPWNEDEATAHNLKLNQHLLNGAALTWTDRRRGARCVASDRIPLVGQISADSNAGTQAPLWLNTGLGSMGTTAGGLGAAAISAALLGWLPPLAAEVLHAIRPERFRERQARRGVRHIQPLNRGGPE
jgi:tRNA 5-methylaminomethyl-2-thiouridine biosynthesis bifunctional protein